MSKTAKKQGANAPKSIPTKSSGNRRNSAAQRKGSAPRAISKSDAGPAARSETKIGTVVALLRAEQGATLDQLMKATGWQRHSVRGAIAGSIKRKLKLAVRSDIVDGERVYRVAN